MSHYKMSFYFFLLLSSSYQYIPHFSSRWVDKALKIIMGSILCTLEARDKSEEKNLANIWWKSPSQNCFEWSWKLRANFVFQSRRSMLKGREVSHFDKFWNSSENNWFKVVSILIGTEGMEDIADISSDCGDDKVKEEVSQLLLLLLLLSLSLFLFLLLSLLLLLLYSSQISHSFSSFEW